MPPRSRRPMDEPRKFVAPEFVFGRNALRLVDRYASNFDATSAFVVTDPGIINAGHVDRVVRLLEQAGIGTTVFSDVSPNPRAEEIMLGAQAFEESESDLIIAVGGGSPMDAAKAIGVVRANHRHVLEFEGVDRVDVPGPPLICIPTTAGTASDVSQFVSISNAFERVKIAIVSKSAISDVALIDPETTLTMDGELTAATGIDALVHAIEAFTSTAASPMTDVHALEAIRLLHTYLPRVMQDLSDIHLRSQVMLASLHAGLAFSNASLGLNHAMAHSISGYLDLPHGECNAILLDHVVGANYGSAEERYDRIAVAMGLELSNLSASEKQSQLIDEIRTFKHRVGFKLSLGDRGVRVENIPILAKNALQDPCMATNPCIMDLGDIEALYEQAL